MARAIRNAIRANRFARIIRNRNPYFYSASGRFAGITRISDSRESPDSRESCESIRANHATKVAIANLCAIVKFLRIVNFLSRSAFSTAGSFGLLFWAKIGGGQTCNNQRAKSICPVLFYYLFLPFVLLELKPFFEGESLGGKILKKCQKV